MNMNGKHGDLRKKYTSLMVLALFVGAIFLGVAAVLGLSYSSQMDELQRTKQAILAMMALSAYYGYEVGEFTQDALDVINARIESLSHLVPVIGVLFSLSLMLFCVAYVYYWKRNKPETLIANTTEK